MMVAFGVVDDSVLL